jgi:osmotically-inducible protein OsmY
VAAARARGGTEPLLNDAALAMKVESELFRDLDVPKGSMNVNVEQGVVVLRGEVGDATTREQLERAAREIAGVWAVDNLLHLPGEPAPTHREAVR